MEENSQAVHNVIVFEVVFLISIYSVKNFVNIIVGFTMRITVWQDRPNYHDLMLFLSFANDGISVSFVFDSLSDVRGAVNYDLIDRNNRHVFSIKSLPKLFRLSRGADWNIILGGVSFKSSFFGHLFSRLSRKIFVSEGRFDSGLLRYRLKNLLERVFCKSRVYVAIGANGVDYFRSVFGATACPRLISYYYIRESKIQDISMAALYSVREFDFAFFGRGVFEKGFDIFIALSEALPNYRFLYVGTPSQEFLKKVSSLENLVWIPWVSPSEVFSWMLKTKFLLVPSRNDPYGCVVQEGLICGCYVICSEYVGARSLVNSYRNLRTLNFFSFEFCKDKLLEYIRERCLDDISNDCISEFSIERGAKEFSHILLAGE